MQYRGFIQFALLLLASACFALGMVTTVISLMVFAIGVELIVWTNVLQQKETISDDSGSVV